MGDDVQAIKAGVLEIADIFVINKADRPGAEHTQLELEGMLSMTEELKPIFRTVATESTGVDELVEHLLTLKRPERTNVAQIRGIDHLAIAVRSLDEALPFYVDQLGLHATRRETVPHEKVTVAMLPLGDTRLELLEALDATSTIARFIDKRGPGLHHVALRVANLTALAATLQAAGIRLLAEPQKGAGGHLYVFLHPADTGGVLLELIQD
ncbi:MAG: transport system ATPase [Bryobacterales bacterium]|nr:transport system ATPase [Bryobacterales bacterium]